MPETLDLCPSRNATISARTVALSRLCDLQVLSFTGFQNLNLASSVAFRASEFTVAPGPEVFDIRLAARPSAPESQIRLIWRVTECHGICHGRKYMKIHMLGPFLDENSIFELEAAKSRKLPDKPARDLRRLVVEELTSCVVPVRVLDTRNGNHFGI